MSAQVTDLKLADGICLIYNKRMGSHDTVTMDQYIDITVERTGINPTVVEADNAYGLAKRSTSFNVLIVVDIHTNRGKSIPQMLGLCRPGFGLVDLIVTNDTEEFKSLYKMTFGCFPVQEVIDVNDYSGYLTEQFPLGSINVAIVTKNPRIVYEMIKESFNDIGNHDIDPEDDIESYCENSKRNDIFGKKCRCPLHSSFIPELFKGWIYWIWYKRPLGGDKNNSNSSSTSDEVTTDAYVLDVFTVQVDDTYVTYWIVNPQGTFVLAELTPYMDNVYIDLQCSYPFASTKGLTFEDYQKIIPFLFSPNLTNRWVDEFETSEWTNIMKNIFTFGQFKRDRGWDINVDDNSKDLVESNRLYNLYAKHGYIYPMSIEIFTSGIVMLESILLPSDINTEVEIEGDDGEIEE